MKYYVLNTLPPDPYREARVEVYKSEHQSKGPAPQCDVCGNLIGPYQYLPPFHDIELELEPRVTRFGDVLSFSADALLVSEDFKNSWQEEGLIGLSGFHRAEVSRIIGKTHAKDDCPRYYHVSVARGRAAIDQKASVLIRDGSQPICTQCRTGGLVKRVARIVLEENTWSGEDIFIGRGLPGTILVTEKFKIFSEQHAWRNTLLINAKDYSVDFCPNQN